MCDVYNQILNKHNEQWLCVVSIEIQWLFNIYINLVTQITSERIRLNTS